MQVWRLSQLPHAQTAFSGEGARLFAGRWNPAGVPIVYTSTSLALAAVELFVNLRSLRDPGDLVASSAVLPDSIEIESIPSHKLPSDWTSIEPSATREFGANWMSSSRSVALRVPSVPIRGDWNLLINPNHPDFPRIKQLPATPWHFDGRMFRP